MSIASVAAQQTAASSGTASQTANNALSSLDGNFTDFLNMLMTQLQNQDPTSPMDSDQFTSELVQFASVEQQIGTNQSLTQLIQATQGSEVIQGSQMIGQQVTVQTTQVPLQNGSATVNISAPTAQPVSIAITNSSGVTVYNGSINAQAGNNKWTWNGTDNAGDSVPDGVYTLVPTGTSGGSASTLTFTVTGTATGVTESNNAVQLQLGTLSVPFSSITSVGNQS
ncbi:MAG TPA: flagellar hook capping FlgD N-terminal domain-containing protein [Acetobacteraceae bacterium]|nr:flagellar hook capping FlgD N-terminal domain-containing protein [Acetobacteraceae bacterium]